MRFILIWHSIHMIAVSVLLFSLSFKLSAQSDTIQIPDQFLFPQFSTGVIKMKNGEKVILNLNYNIVTEKMVFMQRNQIFDMINYGSVDTVYIRRRKFVPCGKVFYEVLVNAPVSLFSQHRGEVRKPSRPAAYGGTSDVSSSTYISNIRLGNDRFRMDNKAEIVIESETLLWIWKDNKMYAVTKVRKLIKIFPDRKKEVREYIRTYSLDIENPGHMVSLVNFYNGLPSL